MRAKVSIDMELDPQVLSPNNEDVKGRINLDLIQSISLALIGPCNETLTMVRITGVDVGSVSFPNKPRPIVRLTSTTFRGEEIFSW